MDVLSDVLAAVRLTGAMFFDIEAAAPWVGESPDTAAIGGEVMPGAEHIIAFHAILSGSCWVALSDDATPPRRVEAGDVLIFPRGSANVLSSIPGDRGSPDMAMYRRPADQPLPFRVRRAGPGGERVRFVCGYLGCDAQPFNPLLASLPNLILTPRPAEGGWVTDLFQVALAEGGRQLAGTETILARLSEVMFVEALRQYLKSLPDDSRGWLSGLRDKNIGAALALIHQQPTTEWTLEGLAQSVGLSRATFADRFAQLVGMPPMQYVSRWRMQLAARRLEIPGMSIARVAAEVGYESEAAFGRAFKKLMGVPPGAWRRRSTSLPGRR